MADYRVKVYFGKDTNGMYIPEKLMDMICSSVPEQVKRHMDAVCNIDADYRLAENGNDPYIEFTADADEDKMKVEDGAITCGINKTYTFDDAFDAACRATGTSAKELDNKYGMDVVVLDFLDTDTDDIWRRVEASSYGHYLEEMERRSAS